MKIQVLSNCKCFKNQTRTKDSTRVDFIYNNVNYHEDSKAYQTDAFELSQYEDSINGIQDVIQFIVNYIVKYITLGSIEVYLHILHKKALFDDDCSVPLTITGSKESLPDATQLITLKIQEVKER